MCVQGMLRFVLFYVYSSTIHTVSKMKRIVFTITLERLSKYHTNLLDLPIFFFIVRSAKTPLSLKLDNTKHVLYQKKVTLVYQSLPLLTSLFHPIILIDFFPFLCSNALIESTFERFESV